MNKVKQVTEFGQQIWLDNLSRELINSGQLARLLAEDGISGITSNPAIFQQAFAKDPAYLQAIAALKNTQLTSEARFEALAIPDIQAACDALLPFYQASLSKPGLAKGLVSFEVSPTLAHDAQGTIAAAKRLWQAIGRPNVMIKIPATSAGLVAIKEVIAAGVHVNVTLMFSPRHVQDVFDAYCAGLTQRLEQGLAVANIYSVASVFISRVDTRIDAQLPPEANALRGKVAIAAAKQAYQNWHQRFAANGDFAPLAARGAVAQSLLWASTGTKNPAYSDVIYLESLIGEHTVNTVPDATLNAFRDHGIARATLAQNVTEAQQVLAAVQRYGIDLNVEGEVLQQEGLALFEQAFANLLEQVS